MNIKKIDVDELLETAQQRTGLSDFGPADFREGLEILADGVNNEADIREQGWNPLRERFLRMLVNRLWFAKDLAEHPEILDEDLGSPVIIASLPRTGSTKLHRMLGACPDFQTLTWWKAHMFARIPGLANGGQERRIRETQEFEKWMYEVSPGMLTGHPMFAEEPEEDQWLMESSFRHPISYGVVDSMKFVQWIMQTDMSPAFDYYLMQLRYLQWQSETARVKPWLVKTPNHMGDEVNLCRLFERPRFIFTHRDPVKCIPSIVHTAMAIRKMYSDSDSRSKLGAGVINMFSQITATHLKWRESKPDVDILDLAFNEIVRDGVGTARKVYDFLGMPFTPAAEQAILEWEANNPKDKHGKAAYSAADLGSTDEEIRAIFQPYMTRFAEFI